MDEAELGIEQYWAGLQTHLEPDAVLVTDSGRPPLGQVLMSSNHLLFADEPETQGGQDSGPMPTTMVLMALGACTAITLRMYAARKGWAIDRIAVRLRYGRTAAALPNHGRIERKIELEGATLDAERRARLFEIAEKCPVTAC
jgi:putative redox protein